MYPNIPWAPPACLETPPFPREMVLAWGSPALVLCAEDGRTVTNSSQLKLSTENTKMQTVFINSDRFLYFLLFISWHKVRRFFCQRQKSLGGGGVCRTENYFHWKILLYFYQASELCDTSQLSTNYGATSQVCKLVASNAIFFSQWMEVCAHLQERLPGFASLLNTTFTARFQLTAPDFSGISLSHKRELRLWHNPMKMFYPGPENAHLLFKVRLAGLLLHLKTHP